MIFGIDAWVVAVLAVTLTVGAAVQGLVGLGLGLVAAPITALLAPELMPALLLWLAAALPMVTLAREHDEIDWRGLAWAVPARVPGTALGVAFVAWFADRETGIAVGVMVLAGVLLTVRAVRVPVNRATLVTAGFVSGVTGTTTSIGGPPLALLYQQHPPRQIRCTLGAYFLVGASLSLAGLAISGELERRTLYLALLMLPCLVLGFGLAGLMRRHLNARHSRAGILVVCGLSAVVLLVKNLFG